MIEIKKTAKGNTDAEVLLVFCLAAGINKVISTNFTFLREKLFISSVPQFLFTNGHLQKYPNKIVSRFKIEEPQCYLTNPSFLHFNLLSKTKSDYLHILSQRSISNELKYIPEHYVDEQYWRNPLITHVDRKIKFTMEK